MIKSPRPLVERMRAYALALLIVLAACAPVQTMPKLTASDGASIAYTYYPAPGRAPGAILLHQFRRDRHDYDAFAPQLQDAGYSVIAIDVRGHGQSSGNWQTMTDADFTKLPLDIRAAKDFLAAQGADTKHLLLVGASFTANAAINYAATDKNVTALIGISPGLDFRGITPEQGIGGAPNTTLLLAAEDDVYSAQSVRALAKQNPRVTVKVYPSGGHGVALYSSPGVGQDILDWLESP
jgi:pimeloyl-ACP methyl ester carboxylesterase